MGLHPRRFFRECLRNFHDVGAFFPSSRFLGRKMAAAVAAKTGRADILEVGAGTGAFTRQILPHLREGDTLDLVEVHEPFVRILRAKLAGEEPFCRYANQVRVIPGRLEDQAADKAYDFVVCGVPFNNFTPALAARVWAGMLARLKPGGILTNVEYILFPVLKQWLSWGERRRRVKAVRRLMKEKYRGPQVLRRYVVIPNIPPAYCRHFRFGPVSE